MATRSSQVPRSARIALASMVIAAMALVALVIASSSPGSLKRAVGAQGASSKSAAATAAIQAAAIQKAKGMIASMPSYFEVNRGQTDPSVRYLSRSGRRVRLKI